MRNIIAIMRRPDSFREGPVVRQLRHCCVGRVLSDTYPPIIQWLRVSASAVTCLRGALRCLSAGCGGGPKPSPTLTLPPLAPGKTDMPVQPATLADSIDFHSQMYSKEFILVAGIA